MTEEKHELYDLLKELVDKVKRLESTVYNADNVLLKAGLVRIDSPSPIINTNPSGMPDQDRIAKMDWSEIDELVSKIKGE